MVAVCLLREKTEVALQAGNCFYLVIIEYKLVMGKCMHKKKT